MSSRHSVTKRFRLNPINTAIFLTTILTVNTALANPTGGTVTSGSASISQSGHNTVIQQNSQQTIIQWNTFNINSNEKTQFVQPNSSSVALNRINPTQGASQIFGALQANGQVILINAAGINFNSGSTVNVGGLIASTSDITDANFLAGKYSFDQPSAYRNASVTNKGSIAASFGLVALLGSSVINSGYIQAEMGSVVLGSGSKFTLDFNGDQLINFTVDAPVANGGVTNTGTLLADGGKILVSAQTASSVLDNEIDMGGVAQANSVGQQNGEIVLSSNGGVVVTGKVSAKGTSAGTTGGAIDIAANNLQLSGATLDTSAQVQGGTINLSANNTGIYNSYLSSMGNTAGAVGGSIQIASNTITIANGSYLTANGDLVGGSITLSGVLANGSMTNANSILLDSFSEIAANGTGTDSDVGGNISLYGNTQSLAGTLSANDLTSSTAVGGTIALSGNNIILQPGAYLDTSANFVAGSVFLGGNSLATNGNTASANVIVNAFSEVNAASVGNDGFGGLILISANAVSIGGELNASGNPLPYITYALSGGANYNPCGFGGSYHLTPTINNSGSSGGSILVTGNSISVQPFAVLTAAGNQFGGIISLGDSSPTTASVSVGLGSVLDVGAYATTGNPVAGIIQLNAINTTVNGTLNASGVANSGSIGGVIDVFASNTVNIGAGAIVAANGDSGGGTILIGGDQGGVGADTNAQYTNIGLFSTISASAITNGNGGTVSVWSDDATSFSGSIYARGGYAGGNGGTVTLSGAQKVNDYGYIDVSAPRGTSGTVIVSPTATYNQKGLYSLVNLLFGYR